MKVFRCADWLQLTLYQYFSKLMIEEKNNLAVCLIIYFQILFTEKINYNVKFQQRINSIIPIFIFMFLNEDSVKFFSWTKLGNYCSQWEAISSRRYYEYFILWSFLRMFSSHVSQNKKILYFCRSKSNDSLECYDL